MYKKIMAPEELFFSRIESVNGESIYVLNFTIFAFIFFPIFTCVDPDPESSWIRIRIHNTAKVIVSYPPSVTNLYINV